jgi:transposase InsO family protein
MSFKDLAKQFGFSRATYYRRRKILEELDLGKVPRSKPWRPQLRKWGEAEVALILKIRRENPTYGKFKIFHIIKRDHNIKLSESTVGRILKHLMNEGKITKSISAVKTKRKRRFNHHAKLAPFKKYENMVMGERVQIDHMTVTKNGISFKHFQAWERKSKTIIAQIYSRARSSDAKKFLQHLIAEAPYKIRSIQVDGGSEFMLEFENACAELKIPLFVNPPATPKNNGGVERGNKTFREEFYSNPNLLADSITTMRSALQQAVRKYNIYRPHSSLNGLTPLLYIRNHSEAIPSHLW